MNEWEVDHAYIDAFLGNMEMNLHRHQYENNDQYNEYIYGSAELFGLMCLCVFCKDQPELFDKLVEPARSLGAAFQKVNFLREMNSDFIERGLVYFPEVNISSFDNISKSQIEQDIQNDFKKLT